MISNKEIFIYFILQTIFSMLMVIMIVNLWVNYSYWFKEATGFCIIGVCILVTFQIMLTVAVFVTWHYASWPMIISTLGFFLGIFFFELMTISKDILPALSFIIILIFSIFWMLVLCLDYLIMFCFVIYTLHPMPQIFGLMFHEETKIEILINWSTFGGLKFFYLAYLKLYPQNIFKISPSPFFVYCCVFLLLFQWALIIILTNKSKRKKLKPKPGRGLLGEAFCPICLEEFHLSSKEIVKTPCNHDYHYNCLKTSVGRDSRCPLCRKNLQQDVISYLLNR